MPKTADAPATTLEGLLSIAAQTDRSEADALKRKGGGGNKTSVWRDFVQHVLDSGVDTFKIPASETSSPSYNAVLAGVGNALRQMEKRDGVRPPIKTKSSKLEGVVYLLRTDMGSDEE